MIYPASKPASNSGYVSFASFASSGSFVASAMPCRVLHCMSVNDVLCRAVPCCAVLGWSPRLLILGHPLACSRVRAVLATFVGSVKCSFVSHSSLSIFPQCEQGIS